MIEEVYTNDWVVVTIDDEIPVLIHKWIQSAPSEVFREQLTELQKLYNSKKKAHPNLMWLADTKNLGERSEEDEKWLQEVWEKLLFEEAGVKVHAVVLADDIYADYSMEQFKIAAHKRYDELGVRLGVFMNQQSAYNWLKQHQ